MTTQIVPSFDGLSGDCETFVSSVQQVALSEERHGDDKWIAGLAASRLSGDALRWFAALDHRTQQSWHFLRLRLLERYGAKSTAGTRMVARPANRHIRASSTSSTSSDSSNYSTSSSVDGSSPLVQTMPRRSSPSASVPVGRVGRLIVTTDAVISCGYVARSPDQDGVFHVTPNASEALHVQAEDTDDGQLMQLRLLNSSAPQENLGLTWYNSGNPDMRYGSASICALSATRVTPLLVDSSASDLYRGPESSAIWSFAEDNVLEAKWQTGAAHPHTLVLAVGPGNCLYGVPDPCSWIEGSWFGRYIEARVSFEPFVRPLLQHSRNSSTLSLPSPARLTALKLNDGLNPKIRLSHGRAESVEWSGNHSMPKPARLGRIRVTSGHPSGNGFVGTTLPSSGVLVVSSVKDDIPLEVRCPEGRKILHDLELLNPRTPHNWLGMTWMEGKTPNLCSGSSSIAALSYVAESRWGSLSSSTSSKYAGEKGHAVWNVADDGTIRATWSDGVVSKSLVFVIDPSTRELFVIPDKTSSWLGEFWGYVRVHLTFENA